MDHVDDIVNGLLGKLEKKATRKGNAVRKAWRQAAGERAVGHTQPVSFKKGTLVVIVENSSWLYKLTMEKAKIIKTFNEEYTGKQKLKNIRFRVGKTDI